MHKTHFLIIIFLALTVTPLKTHATNVNQALTITTWNLEHMMSEQVHKAWREFCGSETVSWDDEKATVAAKPKNLTYCNAHSGLQWPNNEIQESLPLRTSNNYQLKVDALKARAEELSSDIFALQEVSGKKAIERVFSPEAYTAFFIPNNGIAMSVGYAVKNNLADKVSVRTVNELAICDKEDRLTPNNPTDCKKNVYRTRPGLEMTMSFDDVSLYLLNVHLKSSCRSYLLNQLPTHATERNDKGCRMLRDQVPSLEGWIDAKVLDNKLFMVLGDFNRNFVQEFKKNMPARLDGSDAVDKITPRSQIGSIIKELSDNDPNGARLNFEWQNINSPYNRTSTNLDGSTYNVASCHRGIDHFVFPEYLLEALDGIPEKLYGYGSDFGDKGYCNDNARPSDHCPLTIKLNWKEK